MINNIDVHDLPEEEVKVIQEFVEFIREKVRSKKVKRVEEEVIEEKALIAHPSNVIGKLTRREIYEQEFLDRLKNKHISGGGTGKIGQVKSVKNLKPEMPVSDMVIEDRR